MTEVEEIEMGCKDCENKLLYHNSRQTYGCEECYKVWSMERIEDETKGAEEWATSGDMPTENGPFSEIFWE